MGKPKSKKKAPLTRGRGKKNTAPELASASETDESSQYQDEPVANRNGVKLPTEASSSQALRPASLFKDNQIQNKKEQSLSGDLIAELKISRGTSFTYVTNDVRHRQFELNSRMNLFHLDEELGMLKDTLDSSLNLARKLHPESRNGYVSEAVYSLEFPKTAKELFKKLYALPPLLTGPVAAIPRINIPEPIFEESEEEENFCTPFGKITPHARHTPNLMFPSPSKMVMSKFATPKQNGVFHFGTQNKKLLSTNKAPRLPKPGEVFYSEGGSPILQRRLPDAADRDATLPKASERIELLQEDGSKIEVDMVYRGGQDLDKIRGFKEFAKDVRGIAASRSTVKQHRVQPPRIKATSSSATKRKPEWR